MSVVNTDEVEVTQTDWERIRSMTDEEIALAVASDPDAAPIRTAEELKGLELVPARTRR